MNLTNHERLLRLLQGEFSPEEADRVRQDLVQSPALRDELDALQAIQGLLRTTVHASSKQALKPFFADRLMRRLAPAAQRLAAPDEELFSGLLRLFRPVALAALLLILGLASYNVSLSSDYDIQLSTTEAVLGLPPVALSTAYDLDLATISPVDP